MMVVDTTIITRAAGECKTTPLTVNTIPPSLLSPLYLEIKYVLYFFYFSTTYASVTILRLFCEKMNRRLWPETSCCPGCSECPRSVA